MTALRIDGSILSQSIQEGLKGRSEALAQRLGRKPGLAVILVGDNPASKVYVAAKSKAARNAGIEPRDIQLKAEISQSELIKSIQQLNSDPTVDGILLQLPLPPGLDEFSALFAIDPRKDADGLHPVNQGLLLRGAAAPRPCTPKGCMLLINRAREELGLSSKLDSLHAVVIGRSVLVGKPLGLLLLEQNCTVTMCHSKTKNLPAESARADILIAAIGKPQFVTGEFIKPGAIVIDVGINRLPDGKIVGDVDFEGVSNMAAAVTPVPKGVGPMTIAMLLQNTLELAEQKNS